MQLGACLAAFGQSGLRRALDIVAELGLALIDLPADRRLGFLPETEPDLVAVVRKHLAARNLAVVSVSNSSESRLLLGPYGGYTDFGIAGSVEDKRRLGMAAARRTIDLAAALETPHARLFLGCPDLARWLPWHDAGTSWADNISRFIEVCDPLLDYARERGVRILFEPHPKQVAYDHDSVAALFNAVGGRLDLCLDPANLLALGHDPVVFAQRCKVVPSQLQTKDVERVSGAREATGPGWTRYGPQPAVRFRAAGWGEVPWRRLLSCLCERGFAGPVLIEHEDLLCRPAVGMATARDFLLPLTGLSVGHERTW